MASAPPTGRPVTVRCPLCGTLNRVDLDRLSAGPKCAHCHRPILLDRPVKVTDADFDRVIQDASVPVVVDFYADWCGPCRVMAPTLDEFALARAGKVLVSKLDTEANPATPVRFGVRGLPTLVSFRDGREYRRHVGLADLRALEALVA